MDFTAIDFPDHAPRLLLAPDWKSLAECLHRVNSDRCCRLSDFQPTEARSLYPPCHILGTELQKRIDDAAARGEVLGIFGIDGFLAFWNDENRRDAWTRIRELLDSETPFFLVTSADMGSAIPREVFTNPRYADRMRSLCDPAASSSPEKEERVPSPERLCLLDRKFEHFHLPGKVYSGFRKFLEESEDALVEGVRNAVITTSFPPLGRLPNVDPDGISQIRTAQDFLKEFCELRETISDEAAAEVLSLMGDTPKNVLPLLLEEFFPEANSGLPLPTYLREHAPAVFSACKTSLRKSLLLWTLRKALSEECYLKYVLDDTRTDSENFLRAYVCKACELLGSSAAPDRTRDYADERRSALRLVLDTCDGLIGDFVRQTAEKDDAAVLPWLNCGTPAEHTEICRRLMAAPCPADTPVPPLARQLYPLLDDYLSEYSIGGDSTIAQELDDYFRKYRLQKIRNRLLEEFPRRAGEIQYPPASIPSRDALLQGYANCDDLILVVVDALGAEYLPALIALARRNNLELKEARVAYAKVPTSTCFNPIALAGAKRRIDIKAFDECIHDGAASETGRKPSDNLVSLLSLLETKILPTLREALATSKTVVLTSDHGASRLAVLAWDEKVSETIPLDTETQPDDWRYTTALPGRQCPSHAQQIESGDARYWILRGYDRFGKKGGKRNELHGGLTWEELLVPVMVFGKGAPYQPLPEVETKPAAKPAGEFVEEDLGI